MCRTRLIVGAFQEDFLESNQFVSGTLPSTVSHRALGPQTVKTSRVLDVYPDEYSSGSVICRMSPKYDLYDKILN